MYFQNEDQEDQNEDQKTPPWHPEIRSQFLLTRTPPFLASKKSECAQIIWVKSEKLLAPSTFEPGPEQTHK